MAQRVYIGGVSPQGEQLINKYLDAFAPDVEILAIKASGIKGMMKNKATRPDTLLVIIEDSLAQLVEGVASDVLALPKVHRYVTDDDLRDFLITKFGKLEGVEVEETNDINLNVVDTDVTDLYTQPKGVEYLGNGTSPTYSPETSQQIQGIQDSQVAYQPSTPQYAPQLPQADNQVQDLLNRIATLENELASARASVPDNAEINALKARIAELEADDSTKEFVALGKIQKAEQILKQFDEIKKKVTEYKEQVAILTHDKNTLTDKNNELSLNVTNLESEVTNLKAEVNTLKELHKEIDRLNEVIESKDSEIQTKTAEVEGKVAEISGLQSRLEELSEVADERDALKESVKTLEVEKSDLQVDLDVTKTSLTTIKGTLAETKEALSTKMAELKTLQEQYDTLSSISGKSSEEIISIRAELNEKRKAITELSAELSEKTKALNQSVIHELALTDEIAGLNELLDDVRGEKVALSEQHELAQNKITELNARIVELTDSIQNMHGDSNAEITRLNNDVNRLTADLQKQSALMSSKTKESEERITRLTEQYNEIVREKELLEQSLADKESVIATVMSESAESDDASKEALRKLVEERDELTDKIANASIQISELQDQVTTLQTDIDSLNEQLGTKEVALAKLENLVSTLKGRIAESESNSTEVTDLKEQLFQSQQMVTKLTADIEVLKTTDNTEKLIALKKELIETKEELEKTKVEAKNNEKINNLVEQLNEEKRLNLTLKQDISDLNEELAELNDNVFIHIADIALPKAANNVTLGEIKRVYPRFYCMAAGTSESAKDIYKVVKNSTQYLQARVLFIDLVTDTNVDSEFSIQSITNPVDWLSGKSSFRNFVSKTNIPQVRLISTGFAYFNDLFLLQVNWAQRLEELVNYADVVILNIGCLNNVVAKILFNTFSTIMKTFVITKATPINLRNVILTMAGFVNVMDNVTIACTDYDRQTSGGMYQRLNQKYQSMILNNDAMLQL